MSDAKQTAIDTLVEIAKNTDVEPDTRIRAACSILDLEKFEAVEERVTSAA